MIASALLYASSGESALTVIIRMLVFSGTETLTVAGKVFSPMRSAAALRRMSLESSSPNLAAMVSVTATLPTDAPTVEREVTAKVTVLA